MSPVKCVESDNNNYPIPTVQIGPNWFKLQGCTKFLFVQLVQKFLVPAIFSTEPVNVGKGGSNLTFDPKLKDMGFWEASFSEK